MNTFNDIIKFVQWPFACRYQHNPVVPLARAPTHHTAPAHNKCRHSTQCSTLHIKLLAIRQYPSIPQHSTAHHTCPTSFLYRLHAIPDKQENRPHQIPNILCTRSNVADIAVTHGAVAPSATRILCWIFIELIKVRESCNFRSDRSISIEYVSKNRENSNDSAVQKWPASDWQMS